MAPESAYGVFMASRSLGDLVLGPETGLGHPPEQKAKSMDRPGPLPAGWAVLDADGYGWPRTGTRELAMSNER